MHHLMFDIDGTLTLSFEYDKECFVAALQDVLDTDEIDSDWSTYTYVSSTGITMEAIKRQTGRSASQDEINAVESRLMFHLLERFNTHRHDFIEVPGAALLLTELQSKYNISLSLATGCWYDEARFKLDNSGFSGLSIPMASSSDAIAREDIMEISLRKAKKEKGVNAFHSVTFIGDGIWDYRAAQNLGYHFIGVGEHLDVLKENGAGWLQKNYLDMNAFFHALNELQNIISIK